MLMKNLVSCLLVCDLFIVLLMFVACGGNSSSAENGGGSEYNAATGTLTDLRDNQDYKTVVIGKQVWMAENLNYETSGSFVFPDYDSTGRETYGRLYSWDEALKACPADWRLPKEEDWNALIAFVGDSLTAGTKLKAKDGWDKHKGDIAGTDDYGFAAYPGGASHVNGNNVRSFSNNGAFFWTATEKNDARAIMFVMHFEKEGVESGGFPKETWLSVRCIKD